MIPIPRNEIHLWIAHDARIGDHALLAKYHTLLNTQEQQQLQRFRFPQHRHQYLVTRAMVRYVLSLYAGHVVPGEWKFDKGPHGKPSILNDLPVPLEFNISHTDGMVVLALACGHTIGVDVESTARSVDFAELARLYFSPIELRQLTQLPTEQQRERFFDIWTLKEAYIKARGKGLSIALNAFSHVFSEDGSRMVGFRTGQDDTPDPWRFWRLVPDASRRIAIACKAASSGAPLSLVTREVVPLHSVTDMPIRSADDSP